MCSPLAEALVRRTPLWVAPNLITISGLAPSLGAHGLVPGNRLSTAGNGIAYHIPRGLATTLVRVCTSCQTCRSPYCGWRVGPSLFVFLYCSCKVWYYSPDLRRRAPSWVWAVVAVCTFVYQTLDNMDGKQVRSADDCKLWAKEDVLLQVDRRL